MFQPQSLAARILLVEILTICCVAILLPFLTVSLLHRTMRMYEGQLLQTQADQISRGLRREEQGYQIHLPSALATAYSTAYDGRAFAVVDSNGAVVASGRNKALPPLRAAPLRKTKQYFRAGGFLGISLPVPGRSGLWIIVSRDESEPGAILDDVARAFLWRYIAVLLGALALLPLLNSLAIYRLVRAIRQVSAEAGKIAPTNPQTRLNPAGLPSELIQLVRATNSLIDRLQQNSSAQREFIGNLVHELRTPLAALKMELDQIEDELSRSQIHRLLDRVSHVLSQIRDLADLETLEAGQRTTFDLIEVTEQTVAELAPSIFAAGDKISFDFQERPVLVSGQPILVGLALGNLISNASRHTPKGTNILVTVLPSGAVFVVDDGPGISRQTIERPRFRRADRARTDSAGLGLSIVQRIADVHGGKLDIQPRSGRGTRCEISFPLVADGLGAQASMPSALRSAG